MIILSTTGICSRIEAMQQLFCKPQMCGLSNWPIHYCFLLLQIRYCEDLDISAEKGSQLFIYYGLCSAIGRLLAGILCNHKKVNTFFVFQAAEFVAGLSTILVTLTTIYTPLVIYIVVYGVADGFFFKSFSVILLTASPLKPAAVIGWEMMLVSAFLASGPPLAGKNCFCWDRDTGGVGGRRAQIADRINKLEK